MVALPPSGGGFRGGGGVQGGFVRICAFCNTARADHLMKLGWFEYTKEKRTCGFNMR